MDVHGAGRPLQADIKHLMESGVATTGHGENLASTCAFSDARVESALGGWQGLSSAALAAKSDEWQVRANTLLTRVGEHAQVFHTSASTFTEMTHRHVATLDAVAEQPRQVSASSGFGPQDL
jgi:hypothetical protein